MLIKSILPGAWQLTEDIQTLIHTIYVPIAWQQVAANLTRQQARNGYRNIPIDSLNSIISTTFPQIISTNRKSWQEQNNPWIYATEQAEIAELPYLVNSWLREEFAWCIAADELEATLATLKNNDWRWSSQLQSPKDIPFQAIPDYLARKLLQNPTINFGRNHQYQLTFYQVNHIDKGSELMSFPPTPILVGKNNTSISLVINFRLQTVPWREEPLIYHALSVRRWITKPLIKEDGKGFPFGGVTAYVGDTRRWLDGATQPFSFVTLKIG